MRLSIAGMGWVTPLGNDVTTVWQRLQNNERAAAESISSDLGPPCPVFRVPAEVTAKIKAHPRLRRSSAISRFAAGAGLVALEDARLSLDPETAARTALVFAVSNGGVIYTRRFYNDIVDSGAQAASPLLFPETVFNAPASHLAAILGITGATYTVVGDGAVGILAMKLAEDLMQSGNLDHCLVVAAEEADWLLCAAYRKWRLLRAVPPIEPFRKPPLGMIPSEGAGAIVLSRTGSIRIEKIEAGTNFRKQSDARDAMEKIFAKLCHDETDLVVASANGTFVDAAEDFAIQRNCPNAAVLAIKSALGDSIGASVLWQTICGAQSLLTESVPSSAICALRNTLGTEQPPRHAVISACGLNQQAAGLRLAKES